MNTTSTIPTVKTTLVTLYTAALATLSPSGGQVQVAYAWPGPATQSEAVFLGHHPELESATAGGIRGRDAIAGLKTGRKQRDEQYTVVFTVWTFRPDLTVAQATTAEARGFVLRAACEDVLANDPKLGLGTTLIKAEFGDYSAALVPFEKGWASYIVQSVDVHARLS